MSATKRVKARDISHCSYQAIITPDTQNDFHIKECQTTIQWFDCTQSKSKHCFGDI